MLKPKSTLYVVAGPTAVGKTALSIDLAKYLNSIILSADSRQFYKEISIGTAKPSNHELCEVNHYFINNKSISELYSAGEYEKDVIKFLKKHFKTNQNAFLVGGSGMYINAVCKGLDDLPRNLEIRDQLNSELKNNGINKLREELKQLDPIHFEKIDNKNPQRIIRAIEVCRITNKPYSSLISKTLKTRTFKTVKILLFLEKEKLNERIEKRVDQMIDNGLFKEVEKVMSYQNHNALKTVGYKEIFDFHNGLHSKEEAISKIKSNTKKYAKRQMTWFKKDPDYIWIDNSNSIDSFEKIKKLITN